MTTQAELIELFAIHPDTPKIRAHGEDASIAHEPDSQATAIAICVQLLNPKDKMPADKWLWLQVQPVDALKIAASILSHALVQGWKLPPNLLASVQRVRLEPNTKKH
jgi:hypothetical protein